MVGLLVALRRLPDRSNAPEPAPPWDPFDEEIPEDLKTYPGELRDADEEERSSAEQPLHEFFSVNPDASELFVRKGLGYLIPSATRLGRAVHRLRQVTGREPSGARADLAPEVLTDRLRERAREIGLEAGLQYVYTGNIPGQGGEDTVCPQCGATVIRRTGFAVRANRAAGGRCAYVEAWIRVKARWGLRLAPAEKATLVQVLSGC